MIKYNLCCNVEKSYTQVKSCIERFGQMAASYKKLWKLLIDRDMKKRDLCEKAGVSATSIAKLGKGENVNTDILVKICRALKCDISDIMEITPYDQEQERHERYSPMDRG